MQPDNTLIQMHALQLKLFATLCEIFQKHQLQYFLIGGSALGAVRHQGFIPWDDDIDLGMPRADFDRFLQIASDELGKAYELQAPGAGSPSGFAKVRINGTLYVEEATAHLQINQGLFLDIFPLDGVPEREEEKMRHLKAVKRQIRVVTACFINPKAVKNPIKKAFVMACRLLDGDKQNLRLQQLMGKYRYEFSREVANYTGAWWTREIVPKSFFGQGTMLVFEGMQARVPQEYDGYLKSLYGDYWKLPPEEKRTSHHGVARIDLGDLETTAMDAQ